MWLSPEILRVPSMPHCVKPQRESSCESSRKVPPRFAGKVLTLLGVGGLKFVKFFPSLCSTMARVQVVAINEAPQDRASKQDRQDRGWAEEDTGNIYYIYIYILYVYV